MLCPPRISSYAKRGQKAPPRIKIAIVSRRANTRSVRSPRRAEIRDDATGNRLAAFAVLSCMQRESRLPKAPPLVVASNLMQIWCKGQTAMLDINSDINSLSNFKRNTPEFLRQLKETGHPVVLTINGKAELVVQDTASYQKLIELAERAERMEALQASIVDMRAGKVTPVEDMLAEMRQILAEKQGR